MIRITGGSMRGRTLLTPKVQPHKEEETTRPTTDRVRESIFNILSHHNWAEAMGTQDAPIAFDEIFENAHVLDVFAGTGALGLDALSRGAAKATFIERDTEACSVIRQNIAKLKVESQTTLYQKNAINPPTAQQPCTLIFLDPPYRKKLIAPTLEALNTSGWLAPHALIVAETAKDDPQEWPSFTRLLFTRNYGQTTISFLMKQDA